MRGRSLTSHQAAILVYRREWEEQREERSKKRKGNRREKEKGREQEKGRGVNIATRYLVSLTDFPSCTNSRSRSYPLLGTEKSRDFVVN